MRTRQVKPGFFKNEDLAACTPYARLLFVGLWCLADREGRLEDRPARIRAEVFPYEHHDADALLAELRARGFITRYAVGGRKYIQVNRFRENQRLHPNEASGEIPAPEDDQGDTPDAPTTNRRITSGRTDDAPTRGISRRGVADDAPRTHQGRTKGAPEGPENPHSRANPTQACAQGVADDAPTTHQGDTHDAPTTNQIALVSEPSCVCAFSGGEEESSPHPFSCTEPEQTPASEPPFLTFPTVGKGAKTWDLTRAKVAEYREAFPHLDVEAELRHACQWCRDNPSKRKTPAGMPRFLTNWLAKSQNGGRGNGGPTPQAGNARLQRLKERLGES